MGVEKGRESFDAIESMPTRKERERRENGFLLLLLPLEALGVDLFLHRSCRCAESPSMSTEANADESASLFFQQLRTFSSSLLFFFRRDF